MLFNSISDNDRCNFIGSLTAFNIEGVAKVYHEYIYYCFTSAADREETRQIEEFTNL